MQTTLNGSNVIWLKFPQTDYGQPLSTNSPLLVPSSEMDSNFSSHSTSSNWGNNNNNNNNNFQFAKSTPNQREKSHTCRDKTGPKWSTNFTGLTRAYRPNIERVSEQGALLFLSLHQTSSEARMSHVTALGWLASLTLI